MTRILGICGPSGSGKTTLAKAYCERHGYAHIRQDDYFLDKEEMPRITVDGKEVPHWDNPGSLDLDRMVVDLHALLAGQDTRVPDYDKRQGRRGGERTIQPTDVVVCEGFLLYARDDLKDLMTYRVWLDAAERTRRTRRLKRQPDLSEAYYTVAVEHAHRRYREQQRAAAHTILDGKNSIPVLCDWIDMLVQQPTD